MGSERMIFQACECVYCRDKGFPLLYKLDDDKYWLEIPKNGSGIIKRVYQANGYDKIIPRMDWHKLNGPRYLPIKPYVFYRDPIKRFISLYKHYFEPQGHRFVRGHKFLKKIDPMVDIDNTEMKFQLLLDNLDKLDSEDEVHHFFPQSSFFDLTMFPKMRIFPLEKLTEVFGVGRDNTTDACRRPNPTKKQVKFIKKIYEQDYQVFEQFGIMF